VPDDVPAAFPLIAWIAGLLAHGSLRDAGGVFAIALLLLALRRARWALIAFAFAGGLLASAHAASVRARDDAAVARIDATRFATVEVPIEREWRQRGPLFVLRADRFVANGIAIDQPIAIYARFEPPPIAMHERIRAEGFVRRSERGDLSITIKSPRLMTYRGTLSPLRPIAWNRMLANRIRPLAGEHPTEVALVEALALGRAERLDDAVRDDYKRGGTYHLLVFSGLQIAIAAGFIALLLRWLHAPRTSDWLLLLFAILAPLFIGTTASVSRASIGVGLYALTRVLHRPTSIENLWCVAALLRLIIAPADLSDAAFALTYSGAGALLFIGKAVKLRRTRWIVCAAAAELAVTPLTLFHFHQYALGGSIMTLILTPVVVAMLVVSIVVCIVPSASILAVLGALHAGCTALNRAASPMSGFFAAPPAVAVAAGFFLALLAIAMLRGRWRAAAIAASLTLPTIAAIAVGTRTPSWPHLTMLDVGQGDSIVLRDRDRVVLIDGGGRMEEERFGETTLLPLLVDHGIRHVDVVVLTHIHPDHCGGLPAVVTRMRTGEVWISPRRFRGDCAQRLLEACSRAAVPIRLVRDGDVRLLGGIELEAVRADHSFKRAPDNNTSVALQVRIAGTRMLLTGDIEREAESELAPRFAAASLLKVAHHGSRSSTTPALLDAVRPRIALISCGRRNTFGHPHPSVIEALASRGIRTWRTDRNGTIDIELRDGRLFVSPQIDTP